MKAQIGGRTWLGASSTPLPCALVDLTITSKAMAKRIGKIVQPIGIPTSNSCHLVV